MRIAIDASGAAKAKRTGVARYIASLARALPLVGPDHELTLAVRLSRWRRRRDVLRVDAPNVRHRWFQEPFSGWMRRRLDVFHGPDLRIPKVTGVPLVATIHDAFSLTSEMFAREEFRKKRAVLYRDAVDRAAAVITVSEVSRERLCGALDVPVDRVRVVPLGVDAAFRPVGPEVVNAVRARHDLPERYLVFVGQVSRRKNLVRLVHAFDRIAPDHPDLHLVLAGRRSYRAEDALEAGESARAADRIHFTDYFPDEDLPGLYTGAVALAFPSLDEGFGLPALEAMACGTPVVAASAGALPEVCGDAARMVDPEDVDAIAEGLIAVLDDEVLRATLIERGKARAAELTWVRCAERTLAVYREVASS